jgi:hypothetical protein
MTARHDGHTSLFQTGRVSPLKAHFDVPLPPYVQDRWGASMVVGFRPSIAPLRFRSGHLGTQDGSPPRGAWAADGRRFVSDASGGRAPA